MEPMQPLTSPRPVRKRDRWPHMLWVGPLIAVLGLGLLAGGGGLDGWALIVLGAMTLHAGLIGMAVRDRM